MEQIVVTGSMIKRTNAETAEAITVISADSLRDMGITSTEQALQQIASNQSTVLTSTTVSTWGTGGASAADLRGLGEGKTLVLLDGQRLANNVVLGNAVDLNGIPFAAIERIEVVREGASALYGSDAIAGVINFITKKDFNAGQVNVMGSHPQQSGGSGSNADITWGKGNLGSDGYNFMIAGNFTKQNELRATQRSFSSTGFNATRGLENQNGPLGTFPGSYEDSKGNIFQVGYPSCAGNPYLTRYYGDCAYLYSAAVDLIPPESTASGLLSFSKSLPANNTLSAQYFYTQTKVSSWGGPQTYSFLMDPTVDTKYFPTQANSTCVTSCPATPDLSSDITVGWTDPGNNRYDDNRNSEQRLLLSLTGENAGWDYAAGLDVSRNHNVLSVSGGYADYSMLANSSGVLSNLINPFGAQSAAGQALINSAYRNGDLAAGALSLSSVNGHAQHDIGDFFGAGHAATLAVGFDVRRESISYNPTALATTLYSATYYPPAAISGARNVEALFAEFNVPVTRQMEFTVSDREDHYSDFGSTNNGKVAFRYQPVEMVTFRGSASTGFRAPSLVDLYSPQTLGAAAGSMDGPGCPAGSGLIFTAANCIAQGMGLYGGNTRLGPEKSDNYDLGIVISPLANLGITLDYYKITVRNEIQAIPDTAIYSDPGAFSSLYKLNSAGTLTQAPVANTQCASGPTDPTCGYVILTKENTGGIETSGVDLSTNYLLKTSAGKIRVGLEGTLVTNYRLQEYQGAPYLTLDRQFNSGNQPVIGWQHLLTVDWTKGDWGAGISNHYLSGYSDEFTNANGSVAYVSSYTLWNGYVSVKPVKSFTVLVGIRNLFNREPSFSNQTQNWQAGYNPVFSDPTGRAYYAKLSYDF